MMSTVSNLFLGLDSSTQGLKASIIDEDLKLVYERAINFDTDLPQFETRGGAHQHEDGLTVTAPAKMWVAAVDMLFGMMRDEGAPLSAVRAVSGSGQQHGSVWLKPAARDALAALDASKTLEEQLDAIFSIEDSPIWMDFSTTAQCQALEAALGGAQAVATLTGSRAYERFTGNQIAKLAQQAPEAYGATDHIALVSSFLPSLLIGDYAPIDASDGSGMNLMDIRSCDWSSEALEATAPALREKLGAIVPSHARVGALHAYYAERYGFAADCSVVAFSGDNPNSFAGLRLENAGDIAISLGTSDTVFGSLTDPRPSAEEGHIFVSPVQPDAFMAMLVFKNGSLTREMIRDTHASGSWATYDAMLQKTEPGNGGRIGFYINEPEITPTIVKTGISRFGADDNPVEFTPEEDIRAVYEGQFLSMRLHGDNIGIEPRRILATGGASVDKGLIQIMSNVFGVAVYTAEKSDTASLGAAYRALHGLQCVESGSFVPFADTVAAAPAFTKIAEPDMAAHAVYTQLLPRYAALEERVVSSTEG
jgi:xylulokinase